MFLSKFIKELCRIVRLNTLLAAMSSEIEAKIRSNVAPILAAAEAFAESQSDAESTNWRFCTTWSLELAVDLSSRVIELRPRGSGECRSDRLVASVITRYLFELAVNVGAILNAETPELRMERLESWIALREMAVHSDGTYSVALDALGEGAKEKLTKRGSKILQLPAADGSDSGEFIRVEDKAFRFNDPWKLSMSQKVQYLHLKDSAYFLDRWKMYSHISHASAFSIWPRWMDPIPRFDATQCLSVIAKCIARFLDVPFDSESFCKDIYDGMACA